MQSRRIRAALESMPAELRPAAAAFLRGIVDGGERDKVARLVKG
jgi:hypothetical protein